MSMSSQLIAELIDRGITLCAGVMATLIGFGVIPWHAKKPEDEPKLLKVKRLCRWLGVLLIVIGLVLMVEVVIRHRSS